MCIRDSALSVSCHREKLRLFVRRCAFNFCRHRQRHSSTVATFLSKVASFALESSIILNSQRGHLGILRIHSEFGTKHPVFRNASWVVLLCLTERVTLLSTRRNPKILPRVTPKLPQTTAKRLAKTEGWAARSAAPLLCWWGLYAAFCAHCLTFD